MKAVFVHKYSVLRDSHIDPHSLTETWSLMPATLEAMRLLANEDTLVFLFGSSQSREGKAGEEVPDFELLIRQIEAGGGRIDGFIACPSEETEPSRCWGDFPGIIWVVVSQLDLQLEECYLLGDAERDIVTAYAAGARPMIILCDRSVEQVLGNLPSHKDFPVAVNLTTAVRYIDLEEDIRQQLGHSRRENVALPSDEVLYADPGALPKFTITSPLAQGLQARAIKARAQLRDIVRWLTFFVLGALGLSLGIAYLLTHLYRVQPFPEYVYYITLQFIPRPVRGALFVACGLGIIYLAIRSLYRSTSGWRRMDM